MRQLTAAEVKVLIQKGYCRMSRKGGLVSCIDRADWKEHMAQKHAPWSIEEGVKWVKILGEMNAEDFYRRVHSRDELFVGSAVTQFPPSHGTVTGYRQKVSA